MSWNPIDYLKEQDLAQLYTLRNQCAVNNDVCEVVVAGEQYVIPVKLVRAEMRSRFEPIATTSATEPEETSWDPVAYLKRQHTRELLALRDQCHKFHGYYDVLDNHSRCVITIAQVLAELSTREHIPRKNEAKVLRRLMSQNKMSEAEVRATPKFATILAQAQFRIVVDADRCNRYKKYAPDSWVTKKMLALPALA